MNKYDLTRLSKEYLILHLNNPDNSPEFEKALHKEVKMREVQEVLDRLKKGHKR